MLVNILVLVGVLVLLGVLVRLFLKSGRESQEGPWLEFAEATQLSYEPQDIKEGKLSATVKGEYCGRDITLETFRGGGELQTLYTRIQLPVENPDGNYLSVAKKNIFTAVVSRMGVEYVKIGDQAFDQKYVVLARPQQFVKKIFDSLSLRKRLVETKPLEIYLVENHLQIAIKGFVKDVEYLKFLINLICEMADSVDRAFGGIDATQLPAQT